MTWFDGVPHGVVIFLRTRKPWCASVWWIYGDVISITNARVKCWEFEGIPGKLCALVRSQRELSTNVKSCGYSSSLGWALNPLSSFLFWPFILFYFFFLHYYIGAQSISLLFSQSSPRTNYCSDFLTGSSHPEPHPCCWVSVVLGTNKSQFLHSPVDVDTRKLFSKLMGGCWLGLSPCTSS